MYVIIQQPALNIYHYMRTMAWQLIGTDGQNSGSSIDGRPSYLDDAQGSGMVLRDL